MQTCFKSHLVFKILEKLLALWADCPKESGKTGYWRWVQRLKCTRRVCSALSCMAVKPGPHTVTRNACLNTYHLQCLMQIMSITWRDKIPYSEVLRRAKVPSMYALLSQRRLRWLGHVHRMENTRIPKSLLYGQLASGSRDRGRPHLRFRDACKRDATDCCIDCNNWEWLASDRTAWRSAVTKGVAASDKNRASRAKDKKKKRKDRT